MLHKLPDGTPAGLVSNVQKYTIHDGPGIRTEVFFTGCTLRCLWCSNPETVQPRQRFGIYPSKCVTRGKCAWCVKSCPQKGAPLLFDSDGIIAGVDGRNGCERCFRCAGVCPSRAIKIWGEYYTMERLIGVVEEDRSFYQRSGGGVTVSGGEALSQWEFCAEFLKQCRGRGIHTCAETALSVPWESAAAVFAHTDLVIADIKVMDSGKHREYTGAGNELILENLRKTAGLGIKMVIRTPVVPGYNAGDENILKTAEFILGLGPEVVAWQLLPYRKMGTEKYDSLGESYPMGDYVPPERAEWEENLLRLESLVKERYGIPAVAGSSAKLAL